MIKKDNEFVNILEGLKKLPTEEDFAKYIKIFSNYICQASDDYRYNETYLTQYITPFYQFKKLLLHEMEIFSELVCGVMLFSIRFELEVDETFMFVNNGGLNLKSDEIYMGFCKKINLKKLSSKKIQVKCRTLINDKEKIFVKEMSGEIEEKAKIKDELIEFLREGAGKDES